MTFGTISHRQSRRKKRSKGVSRNLTYYELLGYPVGVKVNELWPHEKLKKVYNLVRYKIAKSDMTDDEKGETFKCLEKVWNILGDPVRRRYYDNALCGVREYGVNAKDIRIGGKPLILAETKSELGELLYGRNGSKREADLIFPTDEAQDCDRAKDSDKEGN